LEGVDLGTSYDLANASYDSVSLAVSSLAMGMSFSTDGTSLFIVDRTLDTVVEHTLTTAWDLSTAGSAGSSFSVSGQETNPMEVFFKPDGTKMYVMGTAGDDVNEYNLSTAWNITTASHVQAFSVSAKETYPTGLFFKDDGTKMYITGSDSDSVHEYDLSTAWDVSTASFVQSKDISGQETLPWALFFKDDGTKMFIIGVQGDDVNEYNLSTAWDISTASYNQAFSIASEDTSPSGLYFKSDGSKMYVLGDGNNSVYQYTTGTGVVGATITYDSTIEFAGGTAPTSPAIGDTDILTFSTRDGGTTYQSVLAIDGAK
jgi:DNA-binding beta-propeller fold protein YncE